MSTPLPTSDDFSKVVDFVRRRHARQTNYLGAWELAASGEHNTLRCCVNVRDSVSCAAARSRGERKALSGEACVSSCAGR